MYERKELAPGADLCIFTIASMQPHGTSRVSSLPSTSCSKTVRDLVPRSFQLRLTVLFFAASATISFIYPSFKYCSKLLLLEPAVGVPALLWKNSLDRADGGHEWETDAVAKPQVTRSKAHRRRPAFGLCVVDSWVRGKLRKNLIKAVHSKDLSFGLT